MVLGSSQGMTAGCSMICRTCPVQLSTRMGNTLQELLSERAQGVSTMAPIHGEFRSGDVRHSQADIAKAHRLLGYEPTHDVRAGLAEALPWYEERFMPRAGLTPRAARTVHDQV